MQRRAPRTVWLPSLAGVPLLMVGLWYMAGAFFDGTDVGRGEWTVQVVLPAPASWFQSPEAILGVVLFALGAVLWSLSFKRPDPQRWVLVGSVYPEFMVAGHLLLLMAFFSTVYFQGHVFAATVHGLQWRAIAGVRSLANLWIAGGLGLLCLLTYAFSIGPVRRAT